MQRFDRILLLKMDHIGDALWSFPTVAALRQACPDAWIGMLCTPYLAEVYQPLDLLSAVIPYDPRADLTVRLNILRQLRRQSLDLAIVLGPVDKINHLAWLSGAQKRIGYAYAGNPLHAVTRRLFLTDCQKHPADMALAMGEDLPHEVPSMLDLLTLAGIADTKETASKPFPTELAFPVSPMKREAVAEMLAELCPGKKRFAAVHLCAKSFPFGWNERFVDELVAQLRKLQPQVGWIVTAGPSERPHLSAFRQRFGDICLPLVEGLDLVSMAALLANLDCLVSWDTGVVHLATAVGVPVVDLFPARDYDYCVQRWGPWSALSITLPQHEPQASSQILVDIVAAVSPLLHSADNR